jgi:hypothetical protein
MNRKNSTHRRNILHLKNQKIYADTRSFKKEDFFYILNVLIYFLMTLLVYYPRNAHKINTPLAYLYVPCIIVLVYAGWRLFRKCTIPLGAMIIVQIGILMHIIGGLSLFGARTYSLYIYGIGYDKIVHFYNALAGVIALNMYVCSAKIDLKNLRILLIILVVLGAGAIIEIIEYVGISTLPNTTVWTYAIPKEELYNNNLQDMIANLIGGIVAMIGIILCEKRAGHP